MEYKQNAMDTQRREHLTLWRRIHQCGLLRSGDYLGSNDRQAGIFHKKEACRLTEMGQ